MYKEQKKILVFVFIMNDYCIFYTFNNLKKQSVTTLTTIRKVLKLYAFKILNVYKLKIVTVLRK